jgi:hypothetical protein
MEWGAVAINRSVIVCIECTARDELFPALLRCRLTTSVQAVGSFCGRLAPAFHYRSRITAHAAINAKANVATAD